MMIKLDNITVKQILVFSVTLATSSLFQIENIKSKYLKSAFKFEETLNFMATLGLVAIKEDCVIALPGFETLLHKLTLSNNELEIIKSYIIQRLLHRSNPVTTDLAQFFANFHFVNGHYEFIPSTNQRLAYSGIRNLLIELGFLKLYTEEVKYVIYDNYSEDFVAFMGSKWLSPAEFADIQKSNQRIGRDAELQVIKYERERLALYPTIANMIEHVADTNVAAGYDIKSYEAVDAINPIPRFIEVKAVSIWDYRFYWARNEIEKAKLYGKSYYLYLLPVIGRGDFDLANLRIIQDPYQQVYCNSEWDRKTELFSFTQSEGNS